MTGKTNMHKNIEKVHFPCFFHCFGKRSKSHDYYVYLLQNTRYIPIAKISDTITPRIIDVWFGYGSKERYKKLNPPIMTVPEWEQWLRE